MVLDTASARALVHGVRRLRPLWCCLGLALLLLPRQPPCCTCLPPGALRHESAAAFPTLPADLARLDALYEPGARRFGAGPPQIPKIIHKVLLQDNMAEEVSFLADLSPGDEEFPLVKAHRGWASLNPGYEVRYWNGRECEELISLRHGSEALAGFRKVRAYTMKANLCRYAILHEHGGWYSDWKQQAYKPLDSIQVQDVHWVSAWDHCIQADKTEYERPCMHTGLIGAIPGHPILRRALYFGLYHSFIEFYGKLPLDISGVCALGYVFSNADLSRIKHWNLGHYAPYDEPVGNDPSQFDTVKFKDYDWGHGYFMFPVQQESGGEPRWTAVVKHKCRQCPRWQDWRGGNNYNDLWKDRRMYEKGLERPAPGMLAGEQASGGGLKGWLFNLVRGQSDSTHHSSGTRWMVGNPVLSSRGGSCPRAWHTWAALACALLWLLSYGLSLVHSRMVPHAVGTAIHRTCGPQFALQDPSKKV